MRLTIDLNEEVLGEHCRELWSISQGEHGGDDDPEELILIVRAVRDDIDEWLTAAERKLAPFLEVVER